MARVNLSLPDELEELVRDRLPNINLSEVLRDGLRSRLDCRHEQLICSTCSAPVRPAELVERQLSLFYADCFDAIEALAIRGGTAEGAARVVKDLGVRRQLSIAARRPLPRPTRAERETNRVREVA